MDEPNNLLACPFCGHDALLPKEVSEWDNGQVRQWCDHCGAFGPPGESEKGAHKQWNRRAGARRLPNNGRSAVALHALVRSVRDTNGTTGMEYNDFIQNVEKLCNFAEALQAELDGADKVIANYAQASNVRMSHGEQET